MILAARGRIKRVENSSNKVRKKIFLSPPLLSIFQQTWATLLHSVKNGYTPSPACGVQNWVTTVVMIIYMLAMVRASLFLILLTLKFVHPNTRLPYPIFYMCLTLKNLYFLFKIFVLRITCFLNFTPSYFILRTSWQRRCFFSVGVEMVYIFYPSRLQRRCLKFSRLHVSLLPLMSGIVGIVIKPGLAGRSSGWTGPGLINPCMVWNKHHEHGTTG
jgi:hypothetical protein